MNRSDRVPVDGAKRDAAAVGTVTGALVVAETVEELLMTTGVLEVLGLVTDATVLVGLPGLVLRLALVTGPLLMPALVLGLALGLALGLVLGLALGLALGLVVVGCETTVELLVGVGVAVELGPVVGVVAVVGVDDGGVEEGAAEEEVGGEEVGDGVVVVSVAEISITDVFGLVGRWRIVV